MHDNHGSVCPTQALGKTIEISYIQLHTQTVVIVVTGCDEGGSKCLFFAENLLLLLSLSANEREREWESAWKT